MYVLHVQEHQQSISYMYTYLVADSSSWLTDFAVSNKTLPQACTVVTRGESKQLDGSHANRRTQLGTAT